MSGNGHEALAPPALELRGVRLAFRGVNVLDGIDLTVRRGDFLAIIGPNGGGKTVLLKVCVGLLEPDAGTVRVFGRKPAEVHGLMAYVPQYPQFELDYPIRALDVVLMGRLSGGRWVGPYREADVREARRALEQMGVADLADRQVRRLSGGQLQRVLIARGLAVEAPLILLDEPTASLDARIVGDFYERLAALAEGGRAIVLVSHDIGIISQYVKTVACLNRRLHYHHAREVTREMIEEAYGCEVDFITHAHTHRVLRDHPRAED